MDPAALPVTAQHPQIYDGYSLEYGPGGQTTRNQSPALPFTGTVTLGKSFNLSTPLSFLIHEMGVMKVTMARVIMSIK